MDKNKRTVSTSGDPTKSVAVDLDIEKRGEANTRICSAAYYLVPGEGSRRVAERFDLGAGVYGVNNWKNGDHTFILERISHLEEHTNLLKHDGNGAGDDNLAAILWAGYCLAWYEENKPSEWKKAMAVLQYKGE